MQLLNDGADTAYALLHIAAVMTGQVHADTAAETSEPARADIAAVRLKPDLYGVDPRLYLSVRSDADSCFHSGKTARVVCRGVRCNKTQSHSAQRLKYRRRLYHRPAGNCIA